MIIQLGNKTFELKFGLKGLIYLADSLRISEENSFYDILFAGLMTEQPDLKKEELINLVALDDIPRIKDILKTVFHRQDVPSKQQIEEWYKKGIGEIGLPLATFYCLTPYELDLAYEGYLRRMELQANLFKLSFLQAKKNNTDRISIIEDRGYNMGSIEERQETFKILGIMEE